MTIKKRKTGIKVKKTKKPLKTAGAKQRSQSAPVAQYEELGSLRTMMQKMDAKLSSYPKGSFAAKGEQLGSKFGVLGRLAGRGVGAGLSAISGYGNYTVKKNSLGKVSSSVDMVPQFVKNEHSIRVVHREFIKDIVVPSNPTDFNVNYAQRINPGNSTMFPWLARMAKQYSQYKIHGMVFTFKTMTSDYSANGPLGTIMMATNYDAIERIYANKIELENSEFAVSCKPSESLIHAIECDPKYTTLDLLYIRDPSYDTQETDDRRFYDFGTFQFATSGLPGLIGSTMGEFWVSYDIELCKPIVGGSDIFVIPANTIVSNPSGALAVSAQTRPLNIQWTGTSLVPTSSTLYTVSPDSTSILTFSGDVAAIGVAYALSGTNLEFYQPGKYIVTYSMLAPTTTTNNSLAVGGAGVSNSPCKPTFTQFGTATYTCDTPFEPMGLGADEIGYVPNFLASGGSSKISWQGTAVVVVGGIAPNSYPSANYIRMASPTFTTSASGTVSSIIRRVNIEYAAFGANTQTTTFT